MDEKSKLVYSILGGGVVLSMLIFMFSPRSPYTNELNQLQTELVKVSNQNQSKTKTQTTDPVTAKLVLTQATNKANDLFMNAFYWNTANAYNQNMTAAKADATDEALNVLMPADKDVSGNSQITAMRLSSKFDGLDIYSANTGDPGDVIIVASITASKDRTESDAATDQATLKKQIADGTNTIKGDSAQAYKAHYDAAQQKFTSISYLGKQGLTASTGDDSDN